ncbi:MAG: outer membrane beta-barrel protein [Nitrospiria bacterium]
MRHPSLTTLLLGIAFIFALPLSAMGQDHYVTLKAGFFSPTGDLNDIPLEFDEGFYGGIAYGAYVGPNLALEGGIGFYLTDFSDAVSDDDLVVIPVTVTLKGFFPTGIAEFYAGAGFGIHVADLESDDNGIPTIDDTDAVLGFHLVLGANIDIINDLFFGIEGKHTWTSDADFEKIGTPFELGSNLNGVTVTGNLGVRF